MLICDRPSSSDSSESLVEVCLEYRELTLQRVWRLPIDVDGMKVSLGGDVGGRRFEGPSLHFVHNKETW